MVRVLFSKIFLVMAKKVAAARAIAPGSPYLRESLLDHLIIFRKQPDHYSAVNPAYSTPRRKVGRPSNQSKLRMSAAAEIKDIDLDVEPLSAKEKRNQLPQQVLKKVLIPVNGPSSVASSISSVRDQSSEYDTPGTSVAVTPAESLMKEERSFKRRSRISSNVPSYLPKETFKGKRKRLEVDELMEADAILAHKLQEQEYRKDQEVTRGPRRVRNDPIADSEESLLSDLSRDHSPDPDDFPELDIHTSKRSNRRRPRALLSLSAPAEEDSLDEDETSGIPMPKNKRVKTNHRTSLPSRAARDSANKSIKDRTSRRILDSEDSDLSDYSDDVSLFGSEIASDAFEGSEDADEEADDVVGTADSLTTALVTNNSSSALTAIPGTGRISSVRRGAPSAQATNTTRGRRSWQRRVEDRVSSERDTFETDPGLRYPLGCKRAGKARESSSRDQDHVDRS